MKKLILFGLLSFILGAIWLTPLAFIAPHLMKLTNDVLFQEPQGTIWNGKVSDLWIQNHYLGNASWRVDPIKSLQSLSLKSNFSIKSKDINANGLAGININETLIIENTQFDISAEYINSLQNTVKLSGVFNGFVDKAFIEQKKVPVIEGIVNWQNGGLDTPIKLERGDYRAVIKPIDQNLDIKLSSVDAPIELNGDIKLQSNWVFNTHLMTKSDNLGLKTMMGFAGKPQSDGSILIQQKGDLKPFLGFN